MIKIAVRFLLKLFYLFKVDSKKIFFLSFDGSSYGYDSKALVEYINEYERGNWKMVWGCRTLRRFKGLNIQDLDFVKKYSLKGIYHIMTAGTVFYNINPPSYFPYRKTQLLINTWHGYPFKKVGRYIGEKNKWQVNLTCYYLSHSAWFTHNVLRDSFLYDNSILSCGVPRNDVFFSTKVNKVSSIVKSKLNIHDEYKIALFAPTFRYDFSFKESGMDFVRLKNSLTRKFGGKWMVLFRLHPMIASRYKVAYPDVMDVSLFSDMQDLLCATDVLISDYSGGMWDFSQTRKPVFVFAPDLSEYEKSRGLYDGFKNLPFGLAQDMDELEDNILSFDKAYYDKKIEEYFQSVGSYEMGNACRNVVNLIKEWHGF